MTGPRSNGRPYVGPRLILSPAEAARVLDALHGHTDPAAVTVREKCAATLNAHPAFGAKP